MIALLLTSSFAITLRSVDATSTENTTPPQGKLEVVSMLSGSEIKTTNDKIVIRNVGEGPVNNIRVLLSPEIDRIFLLNDTAIKSIAPNTNVTLTFELNGNRNREPSGNLTAYSGNVIILAEHHQPILLPVSIGLEDSNGIRDYIGIVANIAQQRYDRVSLINSALNSEKTRMEEYVDSLAIIAKQKYHRAALRNSTLAEENIRYFYDVSTSNINNTKTINSPYDELIIKNLSDKPLKNARILLSVAGNAFLLEQKFVPFIEPYGQANIKLFPRFDVNKYSPRDITGQVLIISSYDKPVQIPINVAGAGKDQRSELEVSTISGDKSIRALADKIVMKNFGNTTMEGVELRLTGNLNRLFTLSETSLQQIKPGEEVNVQFKPITDNLMTFLQDHTGELKLMSERHVITSIPISIEWNATSSEHFDVFTRNGDEVTAQQVVDLLEQNYDKAESRLGFMKTKATIYITKNMDELKSIIPSDTPYYYYYKEDLIVLCTCNQPVENALRAFLHRLIINNHASYHNMMKITFDRENWLIDALANYYAADIIGKDRIIQQYLDAFSNTNTTDFQYYGYGTDAQRGAVYTFLEYLDGKYGSATIDKTVKYLASGMVGNGRCFTLESCVVLQAVYAASDLQMSEERHSLSFDAIILGWKDYVVEKYGKQLQEPS